MNQRLSHLIGDHSLTSTFDPLFLRRKVASLSLFYRYYFGRCSDELAACIPPPMARPRSTRQTSFAHNDCVELSNARINRFSDGFFPSTSHLWNSLPSPVFPASFNLPSFKRQVYHHFRDQMELFFYHLFRYFINLLYSFHYLSFPFLRGADSRKGTLCPFCIPIHKKKLYEVFNSMPVAKTMFSEVHAMLCLYFKIPVTSATAERTFSVLKRLKT